ncbi:hypothetical protein ACFSM5_12705 [Lacibacterium aquatile]|uniref:Transporter substrate-binding domain-containing protein n=1 Tax=Lacibacterium aquatile TaxID=1168082 RepID=A0ABW5DRJ6_9PROT
MASGFKKTLKTAVLAVFGLAFAGRAEAQTYVINADEAGVDRRGIYTRALIEQALVRTTAKYGPAELRVDAERYSRLRLIQTVEKGDRISLAVLPSNPGLETRLLPIKVDLADGLLGQRVSLIREQDAVRFAAVEAPNDLKKFVAGAGADWEIALRFKKMGVTVLEAGDYEALFPMLVRGRFDHLSRSVMEVIAEYDTHKVGLPELAVEPRLLIETDMPLYAFLSPSAVGLRPRLQEGLEMLAADGTIRQTVRTQFARDISELNVSQRRRIRLPE